VRLRVAGLGGQALTAAEVQQRRPPAFFPAMDVVSPKPRPQRYPRPVIHLSLMFRRSHPNKDLFAESTMTFGEHLEELRACLFKALIGLTVGVIIGLYVGTAVVDYIKSPLQNALEAYYQDKDLKRTTEQLEELKGLPGLPQDPAALKQMIEVQQMMPRQMYIDPGELIRELKQRYPKPFAALPDLERPTPRANNPASPSGPATGEEVAATLPDLMPIYLWVRLQDDERTRIKSLSAHEAFSIYMKASVLVGTVFASPWVLYQLWSFVAAGLYSHEKRYAYVFFPFSLILFLAGVALAFFVVFKPVLSFLFSFNSAMGVEPDPRISEWLSFVLILPLGFGIGFQLPLVMLFLERIGLMTIKAYWQQWRVAVLVIAVVAMILTPPDPYSMSLMGAPLVLLYFGGILLCKFMPKLH